jgi:hypothetical protein
MKLRPYAKCGKLRWKQMQWSTRTDEEGKAHKIQIPKQPLCLLCRRKG